MYVLIQIIVCYPLQSFAGSFPWCYMYVGWQELRETCILVLALEFWWVKSSSVRQSKIYVKVALTRVKGLMWLLVCVRKILIMVKNWIPPMRRPIYNWGITNMSVTHYQRVGEHSINESADAWPILLTSFIIIRHHKESIILKALSKSLIRCNGKFCSKHNYHAFEQGCKGMY